VRGHGGGAHKKRQQSSSAAEQHSKQHRARQGMRKTTWPRAARLLQHGLQRLAAGVEGSLPARAGGEHMVRLDT
jgi:hypothetical protein